MDNNEIEIELLEEQPEEEAALQLPMNFLSLGEIQQDDVRIYIKQSTYKALEKFAASNTDKELGSILIGDYCEEKNRTTIIISDYIEAKYTDASSATLTFTHETWDYVHKQHDKRFPDKKIVGWQHTHPNYGIFLSNYDMFIQENFVNLPFQTAYVIDPVQNTRGFFQWKDGSVQKLKGYYIYDEIGKPIKIEQTKVKKEAKKEEEKPVVVTRKAGWPTVLLSILVIILLFWNLSLQRQFTDLLNYQTSVNNQLTLQNNVITKQSSTITDLQNKLSGHTTTIEELSAWIKESELKLEEQEAIIKELESKLEGNDDNYVRFISYTVAAGDSLIKICQAHNIDYVANQKLILAINGIADPNVVYVGQTILLPIQN